MVIERIHAFNSVDDDDDFINDFADALEDMA